MPRWLFGRSPHALASEPARLGTAGSCRLGDGRPAEREAARLGGLCAYRAHQLGLRCGDEQRRFASVAEADQVGRSNGTVAQERGEGCRILDVVIRG